MSDAVPRIPPEDGWTLIEAAEALFPEQTAWCMESTEFRRSFDGLSADLMKLLARRPDLQLTGVPQGDPFREPLTVPHAAYGVDEGLPGAFFFLSIIDGTFEIRAQRQEHSRRLYGVRVKAAPGRVRSTAETQLAPSATELVGSAGVPPDTVLFAVDAKAQRVVFSDGLHLDGADHRLVAALLPVYLEDLAAGRRPDEFRYVPARDLAERLEIDEATLRQRVRRLRIALQEQAVERSRVPLADTAVIENRRVAGYRLNPHLLIAPRLLESAPDLRQDRLSR
jgi:hypothetical protein